MRPLDYYRYLKEELAKITLFPERETRDIIFHLTGKSIESFLLEETGRNDLNLIMNKTAEIINRRKSGEPLEYILGRTFFMDVELQVNRSVLIPRPDTEVLVAEVLKLPPGKTIDVGTGSGNIAIVLAKHGFSVVATDINESALNLAMENARGNNVSIEIIHSSFMNRVSQNAQFDYIVSNPPYVSPSEYESLPEEVKSEPYEALVSPQDGLWHSFEILEYSREYLKRGGYVFMEISPLRAEKYTEFARNLGYVGISLLKDLNGYYRVLKARWM